MTLFRPCIDLHKGRVKQIVGATLRVDGTAPVINFESDQPSSHFASIYQKDGLKGGHVIMLGPDNTDAAYQALAVYPGGLQIGGGIRRDNAETWLNAGASHVIVTSWLFDVDGRFLEDRLEQIVSEVGRERLVIDLSCRATAGGWVVAMERWQKKTTLMITPQILKELGRSCAEFLIHAADVEGICGGIDAELVKFLGGHSPIPVTYAGGASSIQDLARVEQLSGGRVDLTIGSALDIFGGSAIRYADCVQWNKSQMISR